jgi:hypothetical protein
MAAVEQIAAAHIRAEAAKAAHTAVRRVVRNAGDEATARLVAAAILRDPPPLTTNMRVDAILRSIPGVGPVVSARILETEQLHDRHRLGRITERQRLAIAAVLDPPAQPEAVAA